MRARALWYQKHAWYSTDCSIVWNQFEEETLFLPVIDQLDWRRRNLQNNYVETWQFVHSSMIDRPNRGGAIRETTISRHEINVIDRLRFMILISHDCESAMKCYA